MRANQLLGLGWRHGRNRRLVSSHLRPLRLLGSNASCFQLLALRRRRVVCRINLLLQLLGHRGLLGGGLLLIGLQLLLLPGNNLRVWGDLHNPRRL